MKKAKFIFGFILTLGCLFTGSTVSKASSEVSSLKVSCVENVTFSCGLTGRICGTSTRAIADRILMLDDQLCG